MPECYTHVRAATKALMRSGLTVGSQQAFLAGANGPDPLYMYKRFKKAPQPNLPALAMRMHREKTGAFLAALVQNAITPVQQSYALGFITHYAADCTLNPYLSAMRGKGMPYAGPTGRARMEASLDSHLYYMDYKTHLVPLQAGTPVLIAEELAQVTTLLHDTIRLVYGEDISSLALADTFHDNLAVRKLLVSRRGAKRAFITLLASFYPDRRGKGSVIHRMQPAKPLAQLPSTWQNPFTKESQDITLDEMLTIAEQAGSMGIVAAARYWLGEIGDGELLQELGDNSYFTGQPCAKPQEEPLGEPAEAAPESAPEQQPSTEETLTGEAG